MLLWKSGLISLTPRIIQSDDSSIKHRHIVLNECGAYSSTALFKIFARTSPAYAGSAPNRVWRLITSVNTASILTKYRTRMLLPIKVWKLNEK